MFLFCKKKWLFEMGILVWDLSGFFLFKGLWKEVIKKEWIFLFVSEGIVVFCCIFFEYLLWVFIFCFIIKDNWSVCCYVNVVLKSYIGFLVVIVCFKEFF